MKAGVFFGGGAFIALHAGYSKGALSKVVLDQVYGVSAGSLWATILAFLGVDKGIEILGTIQKTSDIFKGKDVFQDVGDAVARPGDGIPFASLSYGPLQELLRKYITGKPLIPVTVSRVNIDTGYHQHVTAYPDGTFSTDNDSLGQVLTLDDFLGAVLSSCLSAPLVDAYIDKNGKIWVDGGFREGGPVGQALEDRATELHLCLTGLFNEDCGFSGSGRNFVDITVREMEIMANQNIISAVNLALLSENVETFVYEANGQGSSIDFNQEDIQANILIGSAIQAKAGKDLHIID